MFIRLSEKEWKKYYINAFVKYCLPIGLISVFFSTFGASSSLKAFVPTLIIFCVMCIWWAPKNAIKMCDNIQAKGRELSKQIANVRKIICEGQASKKTSNTTITKISSGWLVLTEDALEYYELEKYQNGGNVAILIDDIVGTSVKGKDLLNTLVVNTKEKTYSFGTHKAQIWKEQIDKTVAN